MSAIMQALAAIPSALPSDASTRDASISALKSSISALESSLKTLEGSSTPWEWVAIVSAFVVFVGIVGEIIVIVSEYLGDLHDWRQGVIFWVWRVVLPPGRPPRWRFWFDIVATVVVLLGVLGEASASLELASINSQLRSKTSELRAKSDQLLALVTEVAADANGRASKNEKEAAQLRKDAAELENSISWRRIPPDKRPSMATRLTPYKGEVAWITYNMNDVESNDFGVDIAETLKLAHWIPTEPEAIERMFEGPVNPGTNKLPRGVVIRSNLGSAHEKAAKALVNELVSEGFDATEGPTIPTGTAPTQIPGADVMRASAGNFGNRPIVYISVEPRPDGPQGDAKLRAAKKKQGKSTPNSKQ
jgi:hypothetical protein